jgi:hypothetical protein
MASPLALARRRARGHPPNVRAAFRAYLDSDRNPEGIVLGLLREIEYRLKSCDRTLSRHASPFATNNSVDDPNICPYNDAANVYWMKTRKFAGWCALHRGC